VAQTRRVPRTRRPAQTRDALSSGRATTTSAGSPPGASGASLLLEATQENPQGEVTVRVLFTIPGQARLQRALYSAQPDGEQTMAVIRVTDMGSGMSRETM
jgi:hypothetical protein